jgi:hypothetical protein
MGRIESARSELAQARQTIENRFDKGLQTGDGYQGFWFDWLFGHILVHEAVTLIREPQPMKVSGGFQAPH